MHALAQRYRAAYSGLPTAVWMLAFVLFINRAGAMVLPFLTLYLTSQAAMSEAAAGRMISVCGLGAITGVLLSGRLIGPLGAIRVQTISLFLSAPALLLVPLWSDRRAIGVSLFVFGLFSEAVRPANATAIAKLTTSVNRTKAFALQRLAANLGLSFGPAFGGVLATIHFGLLFVVDALTTLCAAIALLAFFRLRPIEPLGQTPTGGHVSLSPLKDRVFVAFLGLMLAMLIVFFQFGTTYPLYLRDHFLLSKPAIGGMFAVNTLVIVAFEMLLIDHIKQWPLLRTVGWGGFLACAGFGILPFGSSGAYCVFAMLIVTAGEMLAFPLSAGYVANRAAHGNEGRYMGWYTMVFSLAYVIGPTIGSWLYGQHHDAPWIAGLFVGGAVLAGFYALAAFAGDEIVDAPASQTADPIQAANPVLQQFDH